MERTYIFSASLSFAVAFAYAYCAFTPGTVWHHVTWGVGTCLWVVAGVFNTKTACLFGRRA
jgi:hypothetical protein